MSLRVWLPLNGNLNNYGLSNVTITNDRATVNPDGKIGSCYCPATVTLTNLNGLTFTNCSFCFWAKTSNTTKIWQSIIKIDDTSLSQIHGIYFVANMARVKLEYYPSINIATPNISEWHHYAFTIQNGESKGYLDGKLIETSTESVTSDTIGRLRIGAETAISLNDVRIYDHVLSAKEVHEIAQGLVLHYLMNDHAIAMSKCKNVVWNQLIQIPITNATTTINGITFTDNRDGSYTISGTAEDEAVLGIYYIQPNRPGRKYYLSGCPVGGSLSTYYIGGKWLWIEDTQRDTGNGAVINDTDQQSLIYSSWVNIVVKSGTVISSPIVFKPILIDLTRMFGVGNEPATVEEFKNMFPNPYYPYYPNESGIVTDLSEPLPDCSGYLNNGEISGELAVEFTGSPRYDKCTKMTCPGYNIANVAYNYILTPISLNEPSVLSVSFWYKGLHYYYGGIICTSINNNFQNISASAIHNYDENIVCYIGQTSYILQKNILFDEQWHHYAIIYDGSNLKLYRDGNVVQSIAATGNMASFNYLALNYSYAGSAKRGSDCSYSDFRLYTTALSEADIQDLYALGAQITE